MKYLITFEKGESVRWLGHLDILRTFERAIRRAELPIAFSAGFNPRERIAFASALSVGVTGAAEPAALELTASLPPAELIQRLNEKLPPGIRIQTADEIPDAGSRDLLNRFDRAEYQVACACEADTTGESLQEAIRLLLARPQLPIRREREGKVKTLDVRPFICAVQADEPDGERVVVRMILNIGQEGSVKPQEVLTLLAEERPGLTVRRVHRVRLLAGKEKQDLSTDFTD